MTRISLKRFGILLAILTVGAFAAPSARGAAGSGQLVISVVDRDTGKPLTVRMHLKNSAGRPRKAEKVPNYADHFVVPGKITLRLPVGNYSFEMERGPEYLVREGRFTINPFADDTKDVDMKRCSNMAEKGWFSGDLFVRRPLRDIELVMAAEDLHVVPLVSWWNDQNLFESEKLPKTPTVAFNDDCAYSLLCGGLAHGGTEMLLFELPSAVRMPKGDFPDWVGTLEDARKTAEPWIDLTAPFWQDLPMLVANGQVDSIEVANSQMLRAGGAGSEGDGKARDRKRYPDPFGNAQWSQEIYFRLLDCGLRIPPTAGSGSGMTTNPPGYNRVYVHVDGPFSYEAWWDNLRLGRTCVTNGPLLQPIVNGELPGHVFQGEVGKKIEFELGLTLTTRDPLTYLEIIKDGKIAKSIRFEDYAKSGKLPKIEFSHSGWFLIRAVADVKKTYRFAMTAPYYVEMGEQRRVSKQAAQFFSDWAAQRATEVEVAKATPGVVECHRKARDYWQKLVNTANAD